MPKEELRVERLALLGEALAIGGYPDGTAHCSFERQLLTDDAGSFAWVAPTRGEVSLFISAEGHAPRLVTLGELTQDVRDLVVDLDQARAGRVRVVANGKEHPGRKIGIIDVTDERKQLPVETHLDGSSSVAGEFLLDGHQYWLVLEVAPGEVVDGLVLWNRQAHVDIALLEKNLTRFKDGR